MIAFGHVTRIPAPSPAAGRDQTSMGDPKSPERSAVVTREALGRGARAANHPSLTLPVEGREPEEFFLRIKKKPKASLEALDCE